LLWGEKEEMRADLEQAPNPQTPTPNLTPTKNTNHMFYSVRGDFWGMHRKDLKGTEYLKVIAFR
jgi:hypothetical protein